MKVEDQKSGWTDCDPANTDSQEAARIAEEQRLERESTVSSVQDNLLKSHSESGMCSGSTDYKYYGNRTGVAQQNSTGEGRGIMKHLLERVLKRVMQFLLWNNGDGT